MTPRMLERDLERTVTEYLQLDGWRPIRTDPVSDRARGKGFGEVGMADHLYIRYAWPPDRQRGIPEGLQVQFQSAASVIFIEFKRERGNPLSKRIPRAEKAKIHQQQWIARERSRGALVLLAGVDFRATPEGFEAWYRASGLMRRSITMGAANAK